MVNYTDIDVGNAFTDGMDEAVRQVNEELEALGLEVRFINAGLNTVCSMSKDSPDWARAQADIARRAAQ